ncbi:hypothetical protein ACU686_44730 [Yinghuangia aomiensis]
MLLAGVVVGLGVAAMLGMAAARRRAERSAPATLAPLTGRALPARGRRDLRRAWPTAALVLIAAGSPRRIGRGLGADLVRQAARDTADLVRDARRSAAVPPQEDHLHARVPRHRHHHHDTRHAADITDAYARGPRPRPPRDAPPAAAAHSRPRRRSCAGPRDQAAAQPGRIARAHRPRGPARRPPHSFVHQLQRRRKSSTPRCAPPRNEPLQLSPSTGTPQHLLVPDAARSTRWRRGRARDRPDHPGTLPSPYANAEPRLRHLIPEFFGLAPERRESLALAMGERLAGRPRRTPAGFRPPTIQAAAGLCEASHRAPPAARNCRRT